MIGIAIETKLVKRDTKVNKLALVDTEKIQKFAKMAKT